MKAYKEFQFGWLIFMVLIPIQTFLAYSYFYDLGDKQLTLSSYLISNGIFLLMYLLFYGMTIKIDDDKITVSFGIGVISKTIKLEKINHISMVENPWYYGWGIRLIPNGWLYNIGGLRGIELEFNDTKRVIRIGANDSLLLKNEIDKRIGSRK